MDTPKVIAAEIQDVLNVLATMPPLTAHAKKDPMMSNVFYAMATTLLTTKAVPFTRNFRSKNTHHYESSQLKTKTKLKHTFHHIHRNPDKTQAMPMLFVPYRPKPNQKRHLLNLKNNHRPKWHQYLHKHSNQ